MNQGDSRKDPSGYFTRRRPQSFDLAESTRNGIPFATSVQAMPYPGSIAVPPLRQPFGYWPHQSYHQPHGHRVGVLHRYPGHQLFMQQGPFGGENGQYRPIGYLHQFRMRVPQPSDHQCSTMINGEMRRNRFDYHSEKRHLEDLSRSRFDASGPNYREKGFKSSESARPKSGNFPNGKIKVNKKRKNENNSSNVPVSNGESDRTGNQLQQSRENTHDDDDVKEVRSNSLDIEPLTKNGEHSKNINCTVKGVGKSDDRLNRKLNISFQTPKNGELTELKLCEDEGAVGGDSSVVCEDVPSVNTLLVRNDRIVDTYNYDKNLIDEGAVCDLDKMFQHQEFSRYGSDNNDDYQSDSDLRISAGSTCRKTNEDLFKNSSDEESELENCSYVYSLQHVTKGAQCADHSCKLAGCCSHATAGPHFVQDSRANNEVEFEGVVGGRRADDNSDDAEDTGDFIDTDFPAHNQHILSSSDEMDNISSSGSSDHEDNREICDKRDNQIKTDLVFSCNDLSSSELKFQNELRTLSINENSEKLRSCMSSQLHSSDSQSLILNRTLSYSSSSENENGDSCSLGSQSSLNAAEVSPSDCVCYSPTNVCLDGAAASQLPVDATHKHPREAYVSCPPGAECELPQLSSQCFFHANMFCHGPQMGSCDVLKHGQSPVREHNAFTASSALEADDACNQPHKQDSAGCSATLDSGACCPSGYQPSQVNDLNACYHHTHSHLANGFGHDRPEANFNNDESNRHQKMFVKFPVEDRMDERGSHSASSCDSEIVDGFNVIGRKQDKGSDGGGSEDPLGHDMGDNVDMVLLPMEEEIEPVHHMSAGLCAGGVDDIDEFYHDLQLATSSGSLRATNMSHLYDEHQYLCTHEQSPLRNGMPSKEFYDLIKTVSTTDSYMRFFDKDGQDVQRQPIVSCGDDDSNKQNPAAGGQNSKTERLKVDRVMIWNEYEAYVMQFKQIAVSACGQTAVLNVLKALKFSFEKSAVCKVIQTSLRKEDACIPEYLFSRARAGTTAEELMVGVEKLSGGAVGGRFFHFWPPRKVKLLQWLAYWMKRGAIPMATLNLQQGPHSLWQVPDSWHHQMVYGVSHQGLYLTNPLEIVSERSAMKQLCSDSVLMVRRQDIISRFRDSTDLGQLLEHSDSRWRTMNVLGQVVNVLREFNMPSVPGYRLQVTSHVTIPASYKAGITLFMPKEKSAWVTLMSAPEIPIEN